MRSPTAGSALAPTMRSSSARSRTAAKARSKPSRRPAAGTWRSAVVQDPLGRPVTARWLSGTVDGTPTAVIEMAEASGLSRVGRDERDPIAATSVGTGELLAAAMAQGHERIVLGIGGSATTDGGRGLLEALPAATARLRRRSRRRLRCLEPAARAGRGRRRVRAAEGRDAGPGRVPRRAQRGLGRRPRGRDRSPRTRHARCRRGRRRRVRAARDPGPVPLVRAAARRGARHGGDRLRRPPRPRRSRHHRRGPDRCPDRVRQDRARRRQARPGGRQAVHRRRWQRRARGRRRPWPRSVRRPSRSGRRRSRWRSPWPPATAPLAACGERLARAWAATGPRPTA